MPQKEIKVGCVYKNSEGEFFTPAQSGNFCIVDVWPCSENGEVTDINENPCPVPRYTSDLELIGESKFQYEYPEFNPQF